MKLDVSSLAHTKWECKYHIVFAPKYRRQIIYGKIKQDIGQMIRKLCQYKGIEIHEAEACKDHMIASYQERCKYKGFQTRQNKTELSHYAKGRPVKTTGGLFAWKARKEAEIF